MLALHYLRQRDEGHDERNVRAGLQTLAAYLPEEARAGFVAQTLEVLERVYVEWGRPVPEWIGRLREQGERPR